MTPQDLQAMKEFENMMRERELENERRAIEMAENAIYDDFWTGDE